MLKINWFIKNKLSLEAWKNIKTVKQSGLIWFCKLWQQNSSAFSGLKSIIDL